MSTILSSSHAATPLFKRPLLAAMMTALVATVSLAGCSSADPSDSASATKTKTENKTADTASNVADNAAVAVTTVDIDTVKGEVSLPINPSPIVVYDMSLMQDLAALDVAIDGKPSGLKLDNLQSKKPA